MMDCRRFADLTPGYLAEDLARDEWLAWRAHLGGCGACRSAARAVDPSLVFTALPVPPPQDEALRVERCAVVVQSVARQQKLLLRAPRRAPRWLAAAAAVVLAVGGGLLWQRAPEPTAALEPVAAAAQPLPPPHAEVQMEGEEIRVYQFATDGSDDLAVTFVVNPAINL